MMTRVIPLVLVALSCVGCGASIKLESGEQSLPELFPEARFYLTVQDGSDSKPDNWDGHLSYLTPAKFAAEQRQHEIELLEHLAGEN